MFWFASPGSHPACSRMWLSTGSRQRTTSLTRPSASHLLSGPMLPPIHMHTRRMHAPLARCSRRQEPADELEGVLGRLRQVHARPVGGGLPWPGPGAGPSVPAGEDSSRAHSWLAGWQALFECRACASSAGMARRFRSKGRSHLISSAMTATTAAGRLALKPGAAPSAAHMVEQLPQAVAARLEYLLSLTGRPLTLRPWRCCLQPQNLPASLSGGALVSAAAAAFGAKPYLECSG
jgi:hypothetical protein